MRKKLLLALMALVMSVGAFAYEQNNYVYTPSQRLKLISNALDIANTTSTSGWNKLAGSEKLVSETVTTDGTALTFAEITQADGIYTSCDISEVGTYVAVFKISNAGTPFTTVAGTDNALKRIVLINNAEGDETTTVPEGVTAPVVSGTTFAVTAEEQECAIAIEVASIETNKLVFVANGLPEGTVLSDLQIFKAKSVYDIRAMKEEVALARYLLTIPEFCADEAATKAFTEGEEAVLPVVEAMLESADEDGELDEPETAAAIMGIPGSTEESNIGTFYGDMEVWLNSSSQNVEKYIGGISYSYLTTLAKQNRGWGGANNLELTGGNWQHDLNSEVIATQIQGTYTNTNQCYTAYNTNLPKGKYFIYGEVRNAYCDKNYALTFDLETTPQIFVGKDTIECAPIKGAAYQAFHHIAEVAEDGTFRAGFFWPGVETGSRFEVRRVKIRMFGDAETYAERKASVDAFLVQWNALATAKRSVEAEIATPTADYVWGRDSLTTTLSEDITKAWYDATVGEEKFPVNAVSTYKKVLSDGWVASEKAEAYVLEDVAAASVVTNDELTEWAVSNGVGMSAVRQLQNALNYVKNYNKVFTDLKAAIADANKELEDPINAEGDKATFQTAINSANKTLTDVLASTTDATRVTAVDPETGAPTAGDSVTVAKAITALASAVEAFKQSASLKPIVNIDFDTPVTAVMEQDEDGVETLTKYVQKGVDEAGEMNFKLAFNPDNTTNGEYANFHKGYNGENEDKLRMASATATVDLTSYGISSDDVIKVEFDYYNSGLGGASTYYGLRNAAGAEAGSIDGNNVIGGTYFCRYNNTVTFNSWATATEFPTFFTNSANTERNDNANLLDSRNYTHVVLTYDLKARTIKGSCYGRDGKYGANVQFATRETNEVLMNEDLLADGADVIPAEFYIGCTSYKNAGSRIPWMDNLQIFKYASTSDPYTGVTEAPTAAAKVAKAIKLIENGKFVIKSAQGTFNAVGAKIAE